MELESIGGADLATRSDLNGSWRLLYSNGREIANLAQGLPFGFAIVPTYQPLDLATGRFENQGSIVNRYGVARASTVVVGDVRLAPPNTLNAAGTRNSRNNRVDVDFKRITFSLDEVFGKGVKLTKVLVPTLDTSAAQPANDVTYLDATGNMRVTRGGDDALFIFIRQESAISPQLPPQIPPQLPPQ